MKKRRGIAIVAISLISVASLLTIAAMVGWADKADVVATSETPTAAYTPRPTPTHVARFEKYGTAADNLEFFTFVHTSLLDSDPNALGQSLVDTLVAGGFDKLAMEVTPDKTVSGYAADAIEVSVRMGDQCLVGQKGTNGYTSVVMPVLTTGKCLVGKTRSIDW
jgi:hypothetical protein